jgi:hypothetical protein
MVHLYNLSTCLGQEGHELKARLDYIGRPCLKNKNKQTKKTHIFLEEDWSICWEGK